MTSKFIHSIQGTKPVFLEMPHSGQLGIHDISSIPETFSRKLRFDSDAVRKTLAFGCDSAVPTMSGFDELISSMGLSGIYNDLARVYCDTNRGRDEVSGLVLKGADPDKNHHGVIWARNVPTGVNLKLDMKTLEQMIKTLYSNILKSPLTKDEFEARMKEVYDPYHATIKELHRRIVRRHGFCIHLALHSLPPMEVALINGGYVCGEKAKRGPLSMSGNVLNTLPDVILIHNNYLAANTSAVNAVRKAFQSAGLIVQDGKGPFLGDKGVTKLYGNPAKGVHVIGIEHVTHDIEPYRHLGNTYVDADKAVLLQSAYRQAVENLLKA